MTLVEAGCFLVLLVPVIIGAVIGLERGIVPGFAWHRWRICRLRTPVRFSPMAWQNCGHESMTDFRRAYNAATTTITSF